MIEFTPTDEQKMLIESTRRYAEENLRKVAHDADEVSETPAPAIQRGWELGLLPGLIPDEYGGYADDQAAVTGVLALEELAWGDLAQTMELWAPATFALPVLISGSEEQKQTYLPRFVDIERPIMTAAVMEPSVKFDVWCPGTTATRGEGGYSLSGEKACVPLAAEAESLLVYATDSETGAVHGYIVEADNPGLEIVGREKLMGIRALSSYRIKLNQAAVPSAARLGGDEGTHYPAIINRSRIALGAMAVGVARASLEYARDYATERVQFGVPIATKQAVAFKIADMAIEVDAARLLVWEAAWRVDQGKDIQRYAALVKAQIEKMSLFVTDAGVQILGGHGYIREHPSERWLRDARGFAAFEGLAII